jgi:hypothetical protein
MRIGLLQRDRVDAHIAGGSPAVFISTGPRREDTVWRAEMPFLAALPPAK